jgi:hypothetical protein
MRVFLELIRCIAHERVFDGTRRFAGRQPGPIRHTEDVGIDGDFDLSKHHVEDDAGCLATHAR